jgi:hypothetical protein
MLKNLLLLLLAVTCLTITMPLKCVVNQTIRPKRHLTLAEETYSLKPLRAVFTLGLTIEGLTYDLTIDTGSSDLFAKGENMIGNPVKKISCPTCMQQNTKASISYLDGEV